MLDAAVKALSQMFSPPFRAVLLKSIGLALLLIVLIGVRALPRCWSGSPALGEGWADDALGANAHTPLAVLAWMLSIAAGLGIVVGSVFLMPAVTALVASFFVDDIADRGRAQRTIRDEPPGTALPLPRAAHRRASRPRCSRSLVYLVALPFLLFAGFGAVIFFFATAYLLGREYFELAAMRFQPPAEAKALRKRHQRHGVRRRPVHRRLRVDPDPQSRDAAVRHGVHGAHAQAAGRHRGRSLVDAARERSAAAAAATGAPWRCRRLPRSHAASWRRTRCRRGAGR